MSLSSKIRESVSFDDDKIIIKKTYNADVMLRDAQKARELSPNEFGSDHKYVGSVDMALVNIWLKEAGVSWEDTNAVNDVIKKKLMSNEFQKLRVWDGTW
jgi:hypothetical protein